MKKQFFTKRLLPVLLTFAMLIGAVPAMSLGVSAATADIPSIGSTVAVANSDSATQQKNSKTKRVYQFYVDEFDNGKNHHVYDRHYASSSYDQDIILYCIEFGVSDTNSYTAVRPTTSSHWSSLSLTAREGILLALGLGYPASTLSELGGVSKGDAIAATQTLVWEFEKGLRTSFNDKPEDMRLYDGRDSLFPEDYGIDGTPAETAYKAILARARAYISTMKSNGKTDSEIVSDLEKNSNFILLTNPGKQTMLSYSLPGTTIDKRGSIEVYKKDPNGKNLSGAEFTIYNANGTVYDKLTTNSNGYAITDGGKEKPSVPYGKYTVKETKAPAGCKLSTETWTVTVGASTPTVTINAVNDWLRGKIELYKVDENKKPLAGAEFTFYRADGSFYKKVTTNSNGYAELLEVPFGNYIIKETKAPEGYIASQISYVRTVDSETEPVKVTMVNYPTSIVGRYTPYIYKTLVGRDLKAGEFRFELLNADGNVISTATNDANGKVVFDEIVIPFSDLKNGQGATFYYTIREVEGNDPTIEYDTREIELRLSTYYREELGTVNFSPVYLKEGDEYPTSSSSRLVNTYAAGEFTPRDLQGARWS